MSINKTKEFLYKKYERGGGILHIGDDVIVHPGKKYGVIISQSKNPFKAKIVLSYVNWEFGASDELCTSVEGGHKAVINEYLFSRLEKI